MALISSTSGGSLAAAAFAAQGREGVKTLSNFLAQDNDRILIPRLVPNLVGLGENRSVGFARFLDQQIFPSQTPGKGQTYRDLQARWTNSDRPGPFIILNATDMSSGRTFEFTQDTFYDVCSDLLGLPVSRAVAASAAFPFLLSPVPVKNHWDHRDCSWVPGKRWQEKLDEAAAPPKKFDQPEDLGRARYVHSLRNTGNANLDGSTKPDRDIPFVHLLDGGLSDNLGARAILRQVHDNYATLQAMRVRRILLVQVNARSTSKITFDQSGASPSMVDVALAVAERPMDITSEISSYLSRHYLLELVTRSNPAHSDQIAIYPVDVDFDLLEDKDLRQALEGIGTDWRLPKTLEPVAPKTPEPKDAAGTVTILKTAALNLMKDNPCFQSFTAKPPGPGIETPSESCHFLQIIAQYSSPRPPAAVIASSGAYPPPPPSPAPPPPAAMKVSYAADAFFDFDKVDLKPEGMAKLDQLVAKIREIKLEVVIAVGHTDSIGSEAYNQGLSTRRAESVKAYLVGKGIDNNRVYIEGVGKKRPIADNSTWEGRARNRRVEIEVVGGH